jgi:alanine dehydrogenase
MLWIDAAAIEQHLSYSRAVSVLRAAFGDSSYQAPLRHHHTIQHADQPDATLLLMPAWHPGGLMGVKVVSVYPGNRAQGRPAVQGTYLLLDMATGAPLSMLDGTELTRRRTAAASVLAAQHLARKESRKLVIVGAGAIARHLAAAYAEAFDLDEIWVWSRSAGKAQPMVDELVEKGWNAKVAEDLRRAVEAADIVSSATLAGEPLVFGDWLSPGTHLDLVGGFTPAMREADDSAVKKARIYVDTFDGAVREAGDLVRPLGAGVISISAICGDLPGLTRGTAPGRRSAQEITLFKSVGTAIEDLAVAAEVYRRVSRT